MAARQQQPVKTKKDCRVKIKSLATDSKAGKETHVGLDMRTTEDDWDRLRKLVKTGVTISIVAMAPKVTIHQHVVGEEDDQMNNEKLKKTSKEVERVTYIAGRNKNPLSIGFVRDIGLIKCLSEMYDIHNPFLYIPALDGFELPSEETFNFESEDRVKSKSLGIVARVVNIYNISMMNIPCSKTKFKTTEKRLMAAAVKLLNAKEESDSRKKAKATEKFNSREKVKTTEKSDAKLKSKATELHHSSNKAKTTEESYSRKRSKATEDSDAQIESKATEGSDPRKRAKSGERYSARHELKAAERELRSGRDVVMDESEFVLLHFILATKSTDDQEKKASSRPGSKSVRTCITCGQQEPAPKVFKKCKRCKDEGYPDPPYYCGRDCQVLDWTARHRQQHEKNPAGDSASP